MLIIVPFNVAFWDEKERGRGGFLQRETCFQAFAALNWFAIAKVAIFCFSNETVSISSRRSGSIPQPCEQPNEGRWTRDAS